MAATKLQGLWSAIQKRRTTRLEALGDAGYDTSRFAARPPRERAINQSGVMVNMKAPDGSVQPVPAEQVEHYKSLGATVVGQ